MITIMMHKRTGELFIAISTILYTQLIKETGETYILGDIGCFSDFEIIGQLT